MPSIDHMGVAMTAVEPVAQLVVEPDFDPHAKSAVEMRDVYRALGAQGCPVVRSEAHGGFFMVSSQPELQRAARDWETFSSAGGITLPHMAVHNYAIEDDPPEHTYWRGVFTEVLGRDVVQSVEGVVRRNAAELIDEIATRGSADLVAELAAVVPGNTICRIIGITDPVRVRLGCRLGVAMAEATADPADAAAAVGAFAQFCFEEIGSRRANPGGSDYLSRLANEEVNGHRLVDEEILTIVLGFFFGGHHTTTASLSGLFQAIVSDVVLRDRLVADLSLVPRAAEEAVRLETPLHGFFRQATRDVVVQGCPIPKGSEVWLNYAAGNRDPSVFTEPEVFRGDRKPNPHLGFGNGIHTCGGAALARMELRVITEELLKRIPDVVSTGAPVEHVWGGGNIMSIRAVPVTFAPTPARLAPTDLSTVSETAAVAS